MLSEQKFDEQDTPHKVNRRLVKLLGFKKKNKAELDLIMLWDLPNYLDTKLLNSIIEYLLPYCAAFFFLTEI